MISSYLMGGLGNFMFQISAGYSKSIDMGQNFVVNPHKIQVVHRSIDKYINNVFEKIIIDPNFETNHIYHEPNFHFSPIPNFEAPTYLKGYFQSEKYFKHNKNEVLKLLTSELVIDQLKEKYKHELNKPTCSIHVRRGDYLNLSDHHPVQNMDYYIRAINEVGQDKTFLVFSDDISWCKNNFNFLKNVIYCENNEDYEDLYLMSLCSHNIIANSSFSWWGAWLNRNKNKKVIAPKKWFGKSKHNYVTDDIYFENTIIL